LEVSARTGEAQTETRASKASLMGRTSECRFVRF